MELSIYLKEQGGSNALFVSIVQSSLRFHSIYFAETAACRAWL